MTRLSKNATLINKHGKIEATNFYVHQNKNVIYIGVTAYHILDLSFQKDKITSKLEGWQVLL